MLDNGQRALAHIEKIASLSPIEGADRIEVAQVLGWKVVVKKGEFQGKTHAGTERSADFGSFVVVFEELLVFRLVVEIFVALLELTGRVETHLVEPLHGADVSNLFFHTNAHLGQVVLDDATQLFHASSIIVGNHRNRREEQHDVPGERWRNVEH